MTITYPRSQGKKLVPVLYIDCDGTIRKGYDDLGFFINSPDDVEVFEEIPELLRLYRASGWKVVIISNQGGVACGFMTERELEANMLETVRQTENQIDKLMVCTHHPSASNPLDAYCFCRKPKIGLICWAVQEMRHENDDEDYPAHMAVMVGDLDDDEQLAFNAEIEFIDAKDFRQGQGIERLNKWRKIIGMKEIKRG